MRITDREDGIYLLGHGVVSVTELVQGKLELNPLLLGDALAKINRFAGNTLVPWNDAEHSLLVAHLTRLVPEYVDIEELFLKRQTVVDHVKLWRDLHATPDRVYKLHCMRRHWALLHDLVEVVVGDTPNPVKKADELRRSGDTVEDDLVQRIKEQQLGRYARAMALDFVGTEYGPVDLVASSILELLQDFVKPADKLALLVEMKQLHQPEVLDYVMRLWQVNPYTKQFVAKFDWARLSHQRQYNNISWQTSAAAWREELLGSERALRQAFRA